MGSGRGEGKAHENVNKFYWKKIQEGQIIKSPSSSHQGPYVVVYSTLSVCNVAHQI